MTLNEVNKELCEMLAKKIYGRLIVIINDGKIAYIEKRETIKKPEGKTHG